ncbi:beta-phosphoglucomutase family hydrolase [Nibrella viscosa]|uniref:Beta-phosphoglucomutase n=1 Tax=Nibrella viscosa TaxID=1084524 RepID=A0ABP8KDE0_9BACT
MSTQPIAALFDMDGVIVDNHRYHTDSWFQFVGRYGLSLTPEQYASYINGRVAADSLPYVFQRSLTPEELVTYTEEKEEIYREMYRANLQPTPGLISFLEELKHNQVPMAVGTSAPVSNISFTLDGIQVRSYFDTVVDASMITRGKPDPEIYLTAAERLGIPPERCVVFEDAFSGIEAGLRAGMRVVALATTHTREELTNTGASLIIADFREINFKQLIERVIERGRAGVS